MPWEQKTKPQPLPVEEYILSLPSEKRRKETLILIPLFERATGEKAALWGGSIIGFGSYDYRYPSGHAGSAARLGFSPRKAALTLYLFMFEGALDAYLDRLGKYKLGKSCVYINRLEDIDLAVLEDAAKASYRLIGDYTKEHYGS